MPYAYRGRRIDTTPTVRYLSSAPPEAPTPAAAPEPEPDFESLRKAELVELAEERGVDTEGTKADIIERLSDG